MKLNTVIRFFTCLFVLAEIGSSQAVFADNKSALRKPSEVKLSGDWQSLKLLLQEYKNKKSIGGSIVDSKMGLYKLDQRLTFSGFVPGQGRVQISLTKARTKSWQAFKASSKGLVEDSSKVLLLRGTIISQRVGHKLQEPLAAAVFDRDGNAYLHLRFKNKRSRVRLSSSFYKLTIAIPDSCLSECFASSANYRKRQLELGRVRMLPQIFLASRFCDSNDNPTLLKSVAAGAVAQNGSINSGAEVPPTEAQEAEWVAELGTEADGDFTRRNGSSSNNEIAAVVDAANVIYVRDLKIQLKLKRQIMRDPADSGSVAAEALLVDFQDRMNSSHELGSADVYHLFSGRNFDGFTVGLAYVGVVCLAPSYSYGVTQDLDPSVNYLIVAHEIGHNFGATHDVNTQPPSLMFPSADTTHTQFSDFSKAEISNHVDSYGSRCLQHLDVKPSPTPTPTPDPANPTPNPTTPPGSTPTPRPTSKPSPQPSPGGGGGGGIVVKGLIELGLQASLASNGSFLAQGTVTGAISNLCSGALVASSARNFRKSVTVAKFGGLSRKLTFNAQLDSGSRSSISKSKATTVFLRLEYLCPESALLTTDAIKLVPSRVNPKAKSLKLSNWIKTLSKKVSVVAPPGFSD